MKIHFSACFIHTSKHVAVVGCGRSKIIATTGYRPTKGYYVFYPRMRLSYVLDNQTLPESLLTHQTITNRRALTNSLN